MYKKRMGHMCVVIAGMMLLFIAVSSRVFGWSKIITITTAVAGVTMVLFPEDRDGK